jgi:hypothetical protein
MNRLLNFSLGTIFSLICVQSSDAETWLPPGDYTVQYGAPAAGASSSNSPTKFETVPPDEAEQIVETVSLTRQLLQQRYPVGMARRAVHPKDHGCVKAAFTVNSDIPEKYRVGVFATPAKIYNAWIRFSNATPVLGPDIDKVTGPASRGMAIKLMGVEGDTLLGDPSAKTQDFLLINLPGFAFPNVSEYLEVTKVQLAHNDDITTFFAPPLSPDRLKTVAVVHRLSQTKLGNPLDSPYFSAAPFLFGADRVAKFGVTPRNPENTPVPEAPSVNYLREAMKKSLDVPTGKPAVFDFHVQLRTNDSLPIEDATAEWPEATAPFQNVATIVIEPQNFDNPLQVTECEHFAFTPWHGLTVHQPLGGINRLRLSVYTASSQFRAQPKEPTGFPKWPW